MLQTDTIALNTSSQDTSPISESKSWELLERSQYSWMDKPVFRNDTSEHRSQEIAQVTRASQQSEPSSTKEYFRIYQKWEGSVIEVSDDSFLARLETIMGEDLDIEAEIYLEEVDTVERSLVKPGAIFYWSIGYLDRPSGRIRVSKIRFQRQPSWTRDEREKANAETAELRNLFNAE